MGKFIDLTGKKFNKLIVIKRVEDHIQPCGTHSVCWLCKCECGEIINVQGRHLKNGSTTSCGCSRKEKNLTNGLANTKLYKTWYNIKKRCYNPNDKRFTDYGGRGIKVSDEWLNNFQNFYDWSMDNGYKEGLTIDRINNDGNYEPSNCRWVDMKTQNRNKRNNRLITINGEKHCLAEWCEILNLNYETVWSRINSSHWSPEKALTKR